METKLLLSKLGWSSPDRGKTWNKGDMSLSENDALEYEQCRLIAFHKSFFVCPDCGYKITSYEFIYEQFKDIEEQIKKEKDQMFYSDGTIRVERHTLSKEGFRKIYLRKIYGVWQMLAYRSANGDERWSDLNLSEDLIRKHIELYGEENV